MSAFISRLRGTVVVPMALIAAIGVQTAHAQGVGADELAHSVRRMLERLPYYGVFDYIVFRVEGSTVYLAGYSFDARLKADAEMAAKRVSGVVEVANKIEALPVSPDDDRIRWATFYRIYTDDFLSRYAPGGVYEVLREVRDEQRFPGMQPVGRYPIHIVVKGRRTMLLGAVDNASDGQIAEARAREVSGVFEVENGLDVVERLSSRGPAGNRK